MKNVLIKVSTILIILIVIIFTVSESNINKREKVHILFSLSGSYEYRLYYESIVSELNSNNDVYEIIPAFAQTDNETVLKIIYDKSRDSEYDFMFIHPEYAELLERQQLIYPMNNLISETIGLNVLSDINTSVLRESFKGQKIVSFPFMREQYYFISTQIKQDFITLNDLKNLELEIELPTKKIIENILLLSENLIDSSEDIDFKNGIENLMIMNKQGRIVDYNSNVYLNKTMEKDNFIISSLFLNRNRIDNDKINIVNFNTSDSKIKGVQGSNIFKVDEGDFSEAKNKVFEDLITVIMSKTMTYNYPISKKQISYIDNDCMKYYEFDYYSKYNFKNIANLDMFVSKLYVDFMNSNYTANEIISGFQDYVISKERPD